MRDRPTGLGEDELTAALVAGWAIEASSVAYLPVGAGSYHWSVSDRTGTACFVKVDDLGADEAVREGALTGLRQSFTTALALCRAGLEFPVAPIPATDGTLLRRLTPRYALTVFPMVDGVAGEFGPHRPEDLPELVTMLAALHRATPAVEALLPRTDLRLPGRGRLQEALLTVDRPWTGGPYAEPARELLIRHGGRIGRWLTDFDELVDAVRGTTSDWVITHGEPHPGNVLRTTDGLRLIDWTTVQIAPPARDLWMLTTAFTDLLGVEPVAVDDVLAGYTEATGRTIAPAEIALYQRWWALADVAAFVEDLRGPHGEGGDAAAALTCLTGYLD